jgi:hypothetical protein
VEKEVYIEVPTEANDAASKEAPASSHGNIDQDVVGDFFTLCRNHCIAVLMRETPEKQGYYKLVWKNQTPD